MMKRITATMLALVLLLAATGCGNRTPDTPADPSVPTTAGDTATDPTTVSDDETTPTQAPSDSVYTYKEGLGFHGVYMYARSDVFRKKDVANTYLGEEEYVTCTAFEASPDFGGQAFADAEGAIDFLMSKFLTAIKADVPGSVDGETLKRTVVEPVTVNGFDGVRFEGTVFNSVDDYYVYGYSFIINETPVMAVGLVFSEDQEQSLKDAMKEEIDTIAYSVNTDN